MNISATDTVLLICNEEDRCRDILGRLFEEGFSVIGPASSAALALSLAAQTAPTMALIATPPTGRRKAVDLARELMNAWGVRSWVLPEARTDAAAQTPAVDWAPSPRQIARLARALGMEDAAAA